MCLDKFTERYKQEVAVLDLEKKPHRRGWCTYSAGGGAAQEVCGGAGRTAGPVAQLTKNKEKTEYDAAMKVSDANAVRPRLQSVESEMVRLTRAVLGRDTVSSFLELEAC